MHSGNRVDLNLSQVVSEALAAGSGVDSPTIFNRSVQTSLTLSDGGAVVIGGLVSNSENEGDTRIPILGSIPGLGALFRSSGKQNTRSELILMIQAYIVDEDETDGLQSTDARRPGPAGPRRPLLNLQFLNA